MSTQRKRTISYSKKVKSPGKKRPKKGQVEPNSRGSKFKSIDSWLVEDLSNEKNNHLNAGKDDLLQKNSKDLENNGSSDSNKHSPKPDNNEEDDLTGLQKFMKENYGFNNMDSVHKKSSNLDDHDSASNSTGKLLQEVTKKKNTNMVMESTKTEKNDEVHSISSESESDQEKITKTVKNITNVSRINNESNVVTSESKSNGKKTQETVQKMSIVPRSYSDLQVIQSSESDSSDFELTFKDHSSCEEEKMKKSNTGKTRSSSHALESKTDFKNEQRISPTKVAPPVAEESKSNDLEHEIEQEQDDSDEFREEDLDCSTIPSKNYQYIPTEEERLKLVNMFVQSKYPVLPQHQVETSAGTRCMNQREREEFEQYATLKQGTYSAQEAKQIKQNWKLFCKENDWDPKNPKPFLYMKHCSKIFYLSLRNRKRFLQCLAHGLPNRSLYSVFHKFKVMFDPHKISRYTSKEDEIILNYLRNYKAVNQVDRKFAELAAALKRTRASVWRRYRVLKRREEPVKNKNDFCFRSIDRLSSYNRNM